MLTNKLSLLPPDHNPLLCKVMFVSTLNRVGERHPTDYTICTQLLLILRGGICCAVSILVVAVLSQIQHPGRRLLHMR